MKFIIERTSELAIGIEVEAIAPLTSTVKPSFYSAFPEDTRTVYYVEIDSLEHLLKLEANLHHPLIIQNGEEFPVIEIYDSWRE